MALAPLKPGVVTPATAQTQLPMAQVKAASVAQPAVFTSAATQRQLSAPRSGVAVLEAPKDTAVLVAAWMDEVEASAPPPGQLAFAIHMRRQAARLVELLGG